VAPRWFAAGAGKASKHDRAHLLEDAVNGRAGDRGPAGQGFARWLSAPNFYDISDSHLLVDQGQPYAARSEDTADVLMEEALKFIGAAVKANKPSLTLIWYPSPHRPYEARPEDLALVNGKVRLAEIAAVDRSMGTLRAGLRALGVAEQSLVWFTSDNGCAEKGAAGSGGLRGYKGETWEGGIRVPGIIEWSGVITSGAVSSVPTSSLDIPVTLGALCGFSLPSAVDGVDLTPLLHNERNEMAQRPQPLTFVYQGNVAIIDGDLKLHRRNKGAVLLYDLAADPKESQDLSQDRPQDCDRLLALLDAWLAQAEKDRARFALKKPGSGE
jgi:arylsulfatase A-like enzyme